MTKKICLVIVTYNRRDTVLKNLECVYNQEIRPNHIVVVDNFSQDDTIEVLKNRYPEVELIQLDDNLGFAAGLAAGMKANVNKDFDYFWLMDDDSFPQPDFLKKQLDNLEEANLGILGSYGFIHNYFNQTKIDKGQIQEVDFVLVDCALIKTEVIRKIGVPNASIFMMCEDLEYCKRIKKAGYKVLCLPNQSISRLHLGSATNTYALKWRAYYHSRNHLYILIHFFSIKSLFYFLSMQSKFLISTLLYLKFDVFKLRIIGLYHGLISKMGKTLDPKTLKFN